MTVQCLDSNGWTVTVQKRDSNSSKKQDSDSLKNETVTVQKRDSDSSMSRQ